MMKVRFRKMALMALLGLVSLMASPSHSQAQDAVKLRELKLSQEVERCAFSPDGKLLAAAGKGNVFLWNVATGEALGTLSNEAIYRIAQLVFSPDSKTLAISDSENTIGLWDVETCTLTKRLKGHGGRINILKFSPDGTSLASGSSDKTLRLWDVAAGKTLHILEGFPFSPEAIHFNDGDKTLTVVAAQPPYSNPKSVNSLEVSQYDTRTGEQLGAITLSDFWWPVTLSPKGNLVAGYGKIPATGADAHIRPPVSLANSINIDGTTNTVTIDPPHTITPKVNTTIQGIRLYDIGKGEFVDSFYKHYGQGRLVFATDGKSLAIVSTSDIRFWDGRPVEPTGFWGRDVPQSLRSSFFYHVAIAVSPDDKTYAVVTNKGTIGIWRFPDNIRSAK